jgi:hypothetical protein
MDNYSKFAGYIDGSLSREEEAAFFANIANNEDLRVEFRKYFSMVNTFKSTSKAYLPSNTSINNIYNTLGLTMPAGMPAPNVVPQRTILKPGVLPLIISSLISIIGTAIVIFTFFNPGKSYEIDKPNVYPVKDGPELVNNVKLDNKSIEYDQSIIKSNPLSKKNILNTTGRVINGNKFVDNNYYPAEGHLLPGNFTSSLDGFHNSYDSPQVVMISSQKNHFITGEIFSSPVFDKLNLVIKGKTNWNIPRETISPYSLANFNNTSIGLYYELTEKLGIGLEVSQETFFVKYQGKESNGRNYEYQQQPNFTSSCLNIGYKWLKEDNIFLSSKISAGLNSYGAIGRMSAEISYSPYANISFPIGIEYSDMIFKHQNRYFNSTKLGIYYGLSYKF